MRCKEMKSENAKYVWFNTEGDGRNVYAMFRKTFIINTKVKEAILNLFADTHYQLFINGEFVEFGPVRYDPRFPLYDVHDISMHLNMGKNAIAILVNSYGCKTFKSIPAKAGMLAWGTIETETGESIVLDTCIGAWKCLEAGAYRRYAPKASFALNPFEIYDQCMEETLWKEIGYNDREWPSCVEILNQDAWGELQKRSIPYMSGKAVFANHVLSVLPLRLQEDLYSFDLPVPFIPSNYLNLEKRSKKEYSSFVAYSTFIYSPEDQTLTVGVFLGDNWINGIKAPDGLLSTDRSLRLNQRWKLKKGWNYYFGCVDVYQDILSHYIALPVGKGLVVSTDKDIYSDRVFKHTPMLKLEDYHRFLADKSLPYCSEQALEEIGGWHYITKDNPAQSPCIETSWDIYDEPLEVFCIEDLQSHIFSYKLYPHGFSVIIDMGHMHIVFPYIKLHGVKGAVVDVTYSEHINSDGSHFWFRSNIMTGDRLICSGDIIEWLAANPRGIRYMKITVRKAAEDVKLEQISFRSANYPVKYKGSFSCSDPCLNAVWEMGSRTQAANMEDAYVDCALRERGLYIRDSIIQYYVNLAAFGDQMLMRRCLELFGQSPDEKTGKFRACYPLPQDYTISDFSLNMLEGFYVYYMNTGDNEIIKKYWNEILRNLQWYHDLADERSDLLLDAEWNVHKDISADYGGFHGDLQTLTSHMSSKGIHCVFSCVYLIALKYAAELGIVIGKKEDVDKLQKRIDILNVTIPERFWNPEMKCYSDNLERTTHSVHANLFVIIAGAIREEHLENVKSYVSEQMENIFVNGYEPKGGTIASPNYLFYLFDGLYKAGLEKNAEGIIKQGWGWMLAQGARTCLEYFSVENSHCHAWSASPTYYLSRYVLGVSFPDQPDMCKVDINVKASSIKYAEGAYPHPYGLIEVKWHMEEDRRVFDYVKVPKGVKVNIIT